MDDMVVSFDEVVAEHEALAGGKGRILARLHQAGYPVPDGFVILPAAFTGDELAGPAWEQVQAYLARLRKGQQDIPFAVRSSALSEDSAQASFAGEFETVLDVRTDTMIRQAIHTVYRSRDSQRVHAYSRVQGLAPAHDMAVVVQRLVPATVAGVLFTADPVTGSRQKMVGNYVYGLGEALVSGQAEPYAFTLQRPRGQYEGHHELRHFARRLFKIGQDLEAELGSPQDIEWAIAGGKLYLLQARPITTLQGFDPRTGEWNDSFTGDYLWTNVNVGEAMFDVMTPLSWTWIRTAIESWQIVPGLHPAGNIGGRAYFNVSTFATMYRVMGMSERKMLDNVKGTIHLSLPEGVKIPEIPLSRAEVFRSLAGALRYAWRQWKYLKDMPAFLSSNPSWCATMQRRIEATTTKASLASLWHDEIRPKSQETDFRVLITADRSSDHTMSIWRELVELVGHDDADALLSRLSDDNEPLACLGPLVGLALVARGEMSREVYLRQYGHRGPHEFELSIPPPAEDPDWLAEQLAQIQESPVDVATLLARQRAEFDAAWQRFQERHPRQAKTMGDRLAEAARRARQREAARSELSRVGWVMRTFALRAGELTGLGEDVFFLTVGELLDLLSGTGTRVSQCIPARKQTHERYKALPPYPSIINGRFDPHRWAADPSRGSALFDSHIPLPLTALSGDGQTIVGSPGAAGRVEGLVRCLDVPEESHLLQNGEILVTAQTNVGWTPLFPRAAAIITDVGAPLSHAAIVARELGIPAVVGCGDATIRLRTGDRVRVDGAHGTVEILATSA